MKRKSNRTLVDNKIYKYEGFVQQFDYTTQKLSEDKIEVFYNLLDGPNISKFAYKGTIGINNSSEFIVETKASIIIGPEDRFWLDDGSYGKVISNRIVNNRVYNNSRHKSRTEFIEQIISAG